MKVLFLGGTCEMALQLGESLIKRGDACVFTYRSPEGRRKLTERFGPDGYEVLEWSLQAPKSIAFLLNEPPDVVVDFAHERLDGLWVTMPPDTLASYFSAHITGRAYTIQMLVRGAIKKRRPMNFIYVSSMAVPNPNPGQGLYAASKSAAEELYRTLGLELVSRSIYAVVVRFGYLNMGRAVDFLPDPAVALDSTIARDTLLSLIDTTLAPLSGLVVEIPTKKVRPAPSRISLGQWKTPSPTPEK